MAHLKEDLIAGIAAAQAGDWEGAHAAAQSHQGHAHADWLHAILHKIEPDPGNARYWYGRCGRSYDDFADTAAELAALSAEITAN